MSPVKEILCAMLLVAASSSAGCATMTPTESSVRAPAEEILVSARRALAEEGLQTAEQDTEAGIVFSDWTVHTENDEGSYIYRLVITALESGEHTVVRVRAETQSCPPRVKVYDRCTAMSAKTVPKIIQTKIEAVNGRIAAS